MSKAEEFSRTVVTSTQLNQTTGASLISSVQPGANAVAETVETTLRRTVYASQYTSLQAAINANPGRDIILPPGVTTSGLITISSNNTRIIGSKGSILRRANGTAGNFITITGASCALIGFTIDGNRANQTYSYNVGEVLSTAVSTEVRSLRILNAQSHGIRGADGALLMTIIDNEIQVCGDFGIFVNDTNTGTDPAYGICQGNTVIDFGLEGGGGATTSVGIGIRSSLGGWRIANNIVRNTASRTNDQLGIEVWTNSSNVTVTGNIIDGLVAGGMEFGLSITSYGSVITGNLILGTSSYAIEIIDRAVSCTGNVLRSPTGAGIAVNLNSSHSDPGDIITISGNTIENTSSSSLSFAGIVVDGDPGVTPIAITISGNTCHGLSQGIKVNSLTVAYTITGNTIYNTGSNVTMISSEGTHATIIGNTLFRFDTAGTGNCTGIVVGGSGLLISGNRIAGSGRMDNAILINAGTLNTIVQSNLLTGCNNAVFSNATDASVVIRDNTSTSGYALQTNNRALQNLNITNGLTVAQNTQSYRGAMTVAELNALPALSDGDWAYATNTNATTYDSVVAGGGSNRMRVHRVGSNWRIG